MREEFGVRLNVLDYVSLIFMIIGALNWGLIGIAEYDLVKIILGDTSSAKITYILVGMGGVYFSLSFLAKSLSRDMDQQTITR